MVEVDPFSLLGASIAIFGLLVEHFHYQAGLQERISKMETKIDLFWGALENKLPDMLLKGNPIEEGTDLFCLLKAKKEGLLDMEGENKLAELLDREIHNETHTPGERTAMLLMSLSLRVKSPLGTRAVYKEGVKGQ